MQDFGGQFPEDLFFINGEAKPTAVIVEHLNQ